MQTDMKQVNLDLDQMAQTAVIETKGGRTVCEQLNPYTFCYFFVLFRVLATWWPWI